MVKEIVSDLESVFRNIDIRELGIEYCEFFDVITSIEVFEHIPEKEIEPLLSKMEYLLKKGGKWIVCVPSKNRVTQRQHFRHYSATELEQQFKQYKMESLHYVHKISATEKLLRNVLTNRVYSLKKTSLQRKMYDIYKPIK